MPRAATVRRTRGCGPSATRSPTAASRRLAPRCSPSSEELDLPVENLLTPDYLRRTLWTPPDTREPADLADAVRRQLRDLGARPWQVELVTGALTGAVLIGDLEPPTATEDELLDDGADPDLTRCSSAEPEADQLD